MSVEAFLSFNDRPLTYAKSIKDNILDNLAAEKPVGKYGPVKSQQ